MRNFPMNAMWSIPSITISLFGILWWGLDLREGIFSVLYLSPFTLKCHVLMKNMCQYDFFSNLPLFLCGVRGREAWDSRNSLLSFNSSFFQNSSWRVKIKRLSKKSSLLTSLNYNVCLTVKKAILKEHLMYLFFVHKTKGRGQDNKDECTEHT